MPARAVQHEGEAWFNYFKAYNGNVLAEGYKYFVSAQSEDQRRRHAKHQLAVDQLECSVFYTSYSQKSLLGLKRGILILFIDHVARL